MKEKMNKLEDQVKQLTLKTGTQTQSTRLQAGTVSTLHELLHTLFIHFIELNNTCISNKGRLKESNIEMHFSDINIIMLHIMGQMCPNIFLQPSGDREDEQIDLYLSSGWLHIKKIETAVLEKPSLSAYRWRDYQATVDPHQVQALRMKEVNIGHCYSDLFDFTAQCKNMKRLLFYNVNDKTEVNNNIVTGLTKALPRLNKLKQIDIKNVNLGVRGSQVVSVINSPDMRVVNLTRTGLSGAGTAFMSALHRLPHLSYLYLLNSGLIKSEIIPLIQVMPDSCPNIVSLSIYPTKFTSEETRPVCKLNKLINLELNFETADDCIKALGQFPQPLEMIYLCGKPSISDRLNDFLDVIRPYTKLHYLVVTEGVLDGRGEDKISNVMTRKGGRLVVQPKDSQGWQEYKDQVLKLKNECLSS